MFFYRGQTVLLGIRRRKSMNRTFPPSTTISVSNQSDRKTHYTRTQEFMYAYTRKQIGTHAQTCTHPDHASNFFLEEFYPIVFFHVIVYWLKPYFMHNGKVKRADDWIPHHSIPVMRIIFFYSINQVVHDVIYIWMSCSHMLAKKTFNLIFFRHWF